MKINSNIASFYNASSRVNSSDYNRRVLATEEVSPKAQSTDTASAQSEEKRNGYQPSVGIQQTKVSSDNSYQKRMITDPRFAVERMAGKLMDKLPDILTDMKNLPDENKAAIAVPVENKSSKVVIRENSSVNFNAAQMQLQDISL